MDVTISLPEDISESLAGQWGNVSRHALETIAVEGYRTGALTEKQVRHSGPLQKNRSTSLKSGHVYGIENREGVPG